MAVGGGRLTDAQKAAAKAAGQKPQVRPSQFVQDKVVRTDLIIAWARAEGLIKRPTPRKTPAPRGCAQVHRCGSLAYLKERLQGALVRLRNPLSDGPAAPHPPVALSDSGSGSDEDDATATATSTTVTAAGAAATQPSRRRPLPAPLIIDYKCARTGNELLDISGHLSIIDKYSVCPCKRRASAAAAVGAAAAVAAAVVNPPAAVAAVPIAVDVDEDEVTFEPPPINPDLPTEEEQAEDLDSDYIPSDQDGSTDEDDEVDDEEHLVHELGRLQDDAAQPLESAGQL